MNNTILRFLALFSGRRFRPVPAAGPVWLAGLGLLVICSSAAAQVRETYIFTTNRVLPDGNPAGLADVRTLPSTIASIASVTAHLKIAGEFNGDVYAYLAHADGFCVLLNRVGRTAKNGAGYADHGFDLRFSLDAENGDVHQYQDITALKPGQPLTGTWQPDGRTADPAEVTDGSARDTSFKNFLGLNAAGDWTLYLVDIESGGTNQLTEWSLELSGVATPTLAWTNPAAITYGTALSPTQLNAAVTHYGTNVPGTLVYTPAAGTVLNAGLAQTLAVTFTPDDPGSFESITRMVTVDVAPAPLTITANSTNKFFGAALPALSARYTGFVNGDSAASLATPVTLATTATDSSAVGVYPITAGGAASSNYSINFGAGSLTIVPAEAVLVVASSANPAAAGATVEFTATLSAVAPGAGHPTGTVNFRIDGTIAGAATLVGGVATFSIHSLSHGLHSVVAEYGGDGNFIGGTNALAVAQLINSAPVAGEDTVERYATEGVKVRLATLLANDTDADRDALNISVAAVSKAGGSLAVVGEWVHYTPASGYGGADTFTYTLSDGFGGTMAGTVNVAIKVDNEPAQNLTIAARGDGAVIIRGNGIPGRTYYFEYSDTMAPFQWQELPEARVTANPDGVFEWVDADVKSSRFYRSVAR